MNPTLNVEVRLGLYRTMVLVQTFESMLASAIEASGIGPAPAAYPDEPACAGLCAHLLSSDTLLAAERGHRYALAHGADPRRLATDVLRGRRTTDNTGGTPEFDRALTVRSGGPGSVSMLITDAHTARRPTFSLSVRSAARHHLPVVYVVTGAVISSVPAPSVPTPSAPVSSVPAPSAPVSTASRSDAALRDAATSRTSSRRTDETNSDTGVGAGFGAADSGRTTTSTTPVPTTGVNGASVESVFHLTGAAVERARAGLGPSVLRLHQRAGDRRTADPVRDYQARLIEAGVLSPARAADIELQARIRVEDAVDEALAALPPVRRNNRPRALAR